METRVREERSDMQKGRDGTHISRYVTRTYTRTEMREIWRGSFLTRAQTRAQTPEGSFLARDGDGAHVGTDVRGCVAHQESRHRTHVLSAVCQACSIRF